MKRTRKQRKSFVLVKATHLTQEQLATVIENEFGLKVEAKATHDDHASVDCFGALKKPIEEYAHHAIKHAVQTQHPDACVQTEWIQLPSITHGSVNEDE